MEAARVTSSVPTAPGARRFDMVGHPGYRLRPIVLGPGNLMGADAEPVVDATLRLGLLAVRGLVHARRRSAASWRVVRAALQGLARFDGEAALEYIGLVYDALPAARRAWVEEDMTETRARPWDDFKRRLREGGKEEGRQEGQRELLLRQLRARFGELDGQIVARVEAGSKEQIERWGERLLDAETPEDVLA